MELTVLEIFDCSTTHYGWSGNHCSRAIIGCSRALFSLRLLPPCSVVCSLPIPLSSVFGRACAPFSGTSRPTMPTTCMVRACVTKYGSSSDVRFHKLPTDPHRRSLWLKAIDRNPVEVGSKYGHVCSDPFRSEDYDTNPDVRRRLGLDLKHLRLKDDAVPTQKLGYGAPPRKQSAVEVSECAVGDVWHPFQLCAIFVVERVRLAGRCGRCCRQPGDCLPHCRRLDADDEYSGHSFLPD